MRSLLVGVVLSGALIALSGSAVAAPAGTVSNVQLLLDQSVVLEDTGDSVALFGYIHLQTTVDPATSLVRVKANVTADFVAYDQDPPPTPNPELQRLADRLEELKARKSQLVQDIHATEQTLMNLQLQVPESCGLDLLIYPPGWDLIERCPAMGAFVAVAIRVAAAQRAELQAELQAVLDEIKALMNQIQKAIPKSEPFKYTGSGTFSSASELFGSETQLIGAFTLTSAQGVRRSFTVQFGLSFSPAGTLRSGTAELACATTGICSDV